MTGKHRGVNESVPVFLRSVLAAIRIGVEPARKEKIETAESRVDAFLIGRYALDLGLFDIFMVSHKLVIAACVFIAAAIQRLAFLQVCHGLGLNDQ